MPGPNLPLDFREATGPEPSIWEQIGAAFTDAQVKNSNEEGDSFQQAVRGAWNKLNTESNDDVRRILADHVKAAAGPQTNANPDLERMAAMEAYRASLPAAERDRIPTRDQLRERGREQSLARYYDAQDVLSRASGDGWSGAAQFVGGSAGAMTDPINIASMLAMRYPATSILKTIGIEAVGGMATQSLIEPQTYKYMDDLGIDYSLEDSINSILQAGVGAGAFSGVVRGLEKGAVRLQGNIPLDELRTRYRRAGFDPSLADLIAAQDRRAASSIIRDVETFQRENPYRGANGGTEEAAAAATRHQTEAMRADETVQHGRPFTPAPDGPAPAIAGGRTPEGVELVDLSTLKRDAYQFQYKDSDVDGVTPALLGIDTWAPERAGLIIAWERSDGTRYVVDGHQRHALAGRLTAAGHEPITAPVFVLREADGVSAGQARVKAAIKNIGEGSGSATDAAFVLRSSDAEDLRGLPPNSALVKAAAGLARLSEDAFGMVNNGLADERWGAIVGRLVEDSSVHAQLLQAVQRLDPQSPAAAESMVRDMMAAPRVESQTMDLFGASTTSELLIAERAKVKAAAMSVLGKNRTAFKATLQRQVELEAVGNRIAAQRNREALDADTAAALRLEKDAHLKGWVSDALSQAAKDLRDGKSLTEVTGRLVETLRRGEAAGDSGRAGAGGAGRDAERADGARREGGKRKTEVVDVDLSGSEWREAGDPVSVAVHVNPSDAAIRKLSVVPLDQRGALGSSVRLRYVRDAEGNFFVWRADQAIHEEIADALELKLSDADNRRIGAVGEGGGHVDVENGKVLWDGVPDRPGAPAAKKDLREGGPIAWRRELTRENATTDELEQALAWLGNERKDVIEQVRDAFTNDAAPAGATKADLMTELRGLVREHHVRAGEGADVPMQLFADDADVTRMRAAEDALRQPVMDEGAQLGAAIDAEKLTDDARAAAEAAALDVFEKELLEARKLEEADPRATPDMFVDPFDPVDDMGAPKPRPVSSLLDEIKHDKERLQVLEFCAYPGGKGKA